jgi:hypothetical protein
MKTKKTTRILLFLLLVSILLLIAFLYLQSHKEGFKPQQKSNRVMSGEGLYNTAKQSYCSRYENGINFVPTALQENDLVFLNLDMMDDFMKVVEAAPQPVPKFILMTQNADTSFSNRHLERLRPYVNKIYAINDTTDDDSLVRTIPIGWNDQTCHILSEFPTSCPKEHLLYMNFLIGTNPPKRQACFDAFVGKPFVFHEDGVSKERFHDSLCRSCYVLSPEGTGIDCHRVYESLYVGTIPILKRTDSPKMNRFYETLPVLLCDDWNNINESFLKEKYDALYEAMLKWKEANPRWYYVDFWIDELQK